MPGYNSSKDIQKMIKKYVTGTATAEEVKFIESFYASMEHNELPDLSVEEQEALRKSTFEKISGHINVEPQTGKRVVKFYRYISAAVVLVIVATTTYFFIQESKKNLKSPSFTSNKPLDIAPGSNKATLTLADGSTIILDDKTDGNLKELPGLVITKTHKGELVYTVSGDSNKGSLIASNTVATPRGGQYQVILPDGTHVWLNAASALTYPQSFTGKTRQVKLEGEGYFEVAKNKSMPFHVITQDQDVEVTGTHFNINGYMDENSINTTLLEGSVTVHNHGNKQKIIPGQQATVLSNPFVTHVKIVDTEEVVAWKNGVFEFNNSGLKQIMNQLERWYDIKVNYNSLPQKHYNGMISRSANLSKVLKMLEVTGNIKFEIQENRQLKVMAD